jgi:hypothetical protein
MFLNLIPKAAASSCNLILTLSFVIFFSLSRQMPEQHLNEAVAVFCETLFTSSFTSHYAVHAVQT